jgi:hypothetical protein
MVPLYRYLIRFDLASILDDDVVRGDRSASVR